MELGAGPGFSSVPLPAEVEAALAALLPAFAATATARDELGGTAHAERQHFRQSGLLALIVGRELGGMGASWPVAFETVRRVGRVDGALAHLFGFQHLLLATARLFGPQSQWEPLWRETARQCWFWGNALNPLDKRVVLREKDGRLVIAGMKSFCSGSVDADRLIVSALDERSGQLIVGVLPPDRAGLVVRGDWDALGQRQTDSGGVDFDDVEIDETEIFRHPGPLGTPFAALRPLIAQLVFVHVFLGLAEGAFEALRPLAAARTQRHAAGEGAAWDPLILRRAGELWLGLLEVQGLARQAAEALERGWQRGPELHSEERGEVAMAVAAAKASATRVSLEVTSGAFELAGPRAVAGAARLDRYWRNARVHTLHDPVEHKLRDLGLYALTGAFPVPSFYA